MERKDYTLNRVEAIVCKAVNDAMDFYLPHLKSRVAHGEIYSGVTNVPFARKIARGFCFYIFHERFSLSYSAIAFRSGISRRNVMRSALMIRNTPADDMFVSTIESTVNQRINEELS